MAENLSLFNKMFPNFKSKWEEYKAEAKKFNITPIIQAAPPVPPAPPAPAVKEGRLKDGTVINWDTDTLAVGSTITVVDPANPGGFLPIPDGEIVLEDGTNVTVVAGKVTELESPEAEATEPDLMAALQNENASLKAEIAKVLAQFAAQTNATEVSKAKFEAQTKEIEAIKIHLTKVEKLMDDVLSIPSAPPIEPVTNKLSKKEILFNKLNK